MATKLIYLGNGSFFYHVPARDLTDEDFKERAELWKENEITEATLIKSGLYEKPTIAYVAGSAFLDGVVKGLAQSETLEQPKKKSAKDGK